MQLVTAVKVDVLFMVHPHQEVDSRVLVFLLLFIQSRTPLECDACIYMGKQGSGVSHLSLPNLRNPSQACPEV